MQILSFLVWRLLFATCLPVCSCYDWTTPTWTMDVRFRSSTGMKGDPMGHLDNSLSRSLPWQQEAATPLASAPPIRESRANEKLRHSHMLLPNDWRQPRLGTRIHRGKYSDILITRKKKYKPLFLYSSIDPLYQIFFPFSFNSACITCRVLKIFFLFWTII